jgi:hypothetical protein
MCRTRRFADMLHRQLWAARGEGALSFELVRSSPVLCSRKYLVDRIEMRRDGGYRRRMGLPLVSCRAGLIMLIVSSCALEAQTASQSSAPPTARQAAVPATRVFASDAGIVLNFIRPDKTADFEAVVAKLRAALQNSDMPERVQQAASWNVFRAQESAANGSVLYVFVIDPAVKGADYTVSRILAEAFPDEIQPLYKKFAESYATGQNVMNLTLVSALGEASFSRK